MMPNVIIVYALSIQTNILRPVKKNKQTIKLNMYIHVYFLMELHK